MASNFVLSWGRFTFEILVLTICTAVLLFIRNGGISTFRRGFFCDDESIRYPYHGQTISETQVKLATLGFGSVVILITELIVNRELAKEGLKSHFLCVDAPLWIYYAYKYLLGFMVAMVLNEDIRLVVSSQIGRLRPSFLDACEPDLDLSDCREFGNSYITNYTCMAGSVENGWRVSFYSGHSSSCACAAAFVVMYIGSRWNRQGVGRILTAFVSFDLILAALIVAATRVSDYMHHPSDVITGLLMGACMGSFFARYVCHLEHNREDEELDELSASPSEKQSLLGSVDVDDVEN